MNSDHQSTDLREQLATIEHERWADWQKWCHEVLRTNLNRYGLNLDLENVLLRWDRQIAIPYTELTDTEKASDMEQVDRYWPLLQEYITHAENRAVVAALDKIVLPQKNNFAPSGSIPDAFDRGIIASAAALEAVRSEYK